MKLGEELGSGLAPIKNRVARTNVRAEFFRELEPVGCRAGFV